VSFICGAGHAAVIAHSTLHLIIQLSPRPRRLFCQLSLGGPATGLAFGMAMTAWLRFMYNNPMAEITLTVLTAYATYVVGDRLFGVSGVLAVVILGARAFTAASYQLSCIFNALEDR
jgi:NhaP-type Na+/H+ or K+/H+ antiporter